MEKVWIKWVYDNGVSIQLLHDPLYDGNIERYEINPFYEVIRNE